MMSDDRLVTLANEGDQAAAEGLFRRYQNRIFSYLVRLLGDHALAEEATQETFFKGFRALKTYRRQGPFKSWLFSIAQREGLRLAQKERGQQWGPAYARADDNTLCEEVADPAPLPLEVVTHHDQTQQVEQALARLSGKEKEVVLLRVYEGLPFKEIARITGCPLNTVLGRMHTALKKLKGELNRDRV